MGTIYWVTGIILGISIGIGLALRIVVELIMISNDIGDSSGTVKDFGHGLAICDKKDGLSRKKLTKKLDSGRALLNIRRDTVGRPRK